MLETSQPRKPRMGFNFEAFADFMRELGFDTSAKIAAELGVAESVISKLRRGLQQPSPDFIALIWTKYPDKARDAFLTVQGAAA